MNKMAIENGILMLWVIKCVTFSVYVDLYVPLVIHDSGSFWWVVLHIFGCTSNHIGKLGWQELGINSLIEPSRGVCLYFVHVSVLNNRAWSMYSCYRSCPLNIRFGESVHLASDSQQVTVFDVNHHWSLHHSSRYCGEEKGFTLTNAG